MDLVDPLALIALHQEIRAADERAEAVRECPGIAPATMEACIATCTEQALAASDLGRWEDYRREGPRL